MILSTIHTERVRLKTANSRYYGNFERTPQGMIYHTAAGHYDIKAGKHYWFVRDRLGSTVAVVDGDGTLMQTTGYYPSGTPYQLPVTTHATAIDAATDQLHIGNRWIGTKGLDLYDNTARMHDPLLARYTSTFCFGNAARSRFYLATARQNGPTTAKSIGELANARFNTVDPLFGDYPGQSPWSHCAANPINAIDPTGEYLQFTGENQLGGLEELKSAIKGLEISMREDGFIEYSWNGLDELNENAKRLMEVIDNTKITVQMLTKNGTTLDNGSFFVGGAFCGNSYDSSSETVTTYQTVNPSILRTLSMSNGKPGQDMLHEITESYQGGLVALQNQTSYPEFGATNPIYSSSHNMAVPQSGPLFEDKIVDINTKVLNTIFTTRITQYRTRNNAILFNRIILNNLK